MKESKQYIDFFQKNLWYFLAASVVFSCIGFFYQLHSPIIYTNSRLLEIGEDMGSVTDRSKLVDVAVTIARSENIQKQYNILSDIAIFNNSPLSVVVQSSSRNEQQSTNDLDKTTQILTNKFHFSRLGVDNSYVQESNLFMGIIVGFLMGNFLVIVFLLIKSYLKNY